MNNLKEYIKYVNPFHLMKVWKDKEISMSKKITTSLPLIGLIFLAFINSNLETKQALEYNAYLKDYNCENLNWKRKGRMIVEKGYSIIKLSKDLNEGVFDLIEIPSRVEDIRCDWAKNLYIQHDGYFRKADIYLGYPANEEYVDCFCKGFLTAATNYINDN